MPDFSALPYPELFTKIFDLLPNRKELFLVGGSVRDILMQRPIHDLDFVMSEDIRPLARKIANTLKGSFFMLDDERNTARVICPISEKTELVIDFSTLRANNLEEDLRARDFTINAIAINLADPHQIIDPLGGTTDIKNKLLRLCTPAAIQEDPLRILRAVRLALMLQFRIETPALQAMRTALPLLPRVSIERQRDELFRMLDGRHPHAAIRMLDQVGVLKLLLPELQDLKGVEQTTPHVLNVWEHTLVVLQELEKLFSVLVGAYREENASNLNLGLAVLRLGRYRNPMEQHFGVPLSSGRSRRALLCLAALYHDIAKPETQSIGKDGRIHFYQHDRRGCSIIGQRAQALALSQAEVQYLETVVQHHMRIHFISSENNQPSRRTIYRFFHAAGDTGVDICLHSLADVVATYRHTLTQERWEKELDICRALLEAWWEHKETQVNPPRLLTGNDALEIFQLQPGPRIGSLLEAVQEAQAAGEITGRDQALEFARDWLANPGNGHK